MVNLDYLLHPEDLQRASAVDMATATGTQLDFYLFCGSISFRIDAASFDAPWKWIPVFDFGIKINEIVSSIIDDEERLLEFTESEATISFARMGPDVCVTATYTPSVGTVALQKLRVAAEEFLDKLKVDLLTRFPALLGNAAFKERLALVGVGV